MSSQVSKAPRVSEPVSFDEDNIYYISDRSMHDTKTEEKKVYGKEDKEIIQYANWSIVPISAIFYLFFFKHNHC